MTWTTSATGPAKTGVLVDDVREASPAAKAGIKNGDEIVELDGERVRSVRQFTRLVQDTPVGRKVPVVVVRRWTAGHADRGARARVRLGDPATTSRGSCRPSRRLHPQRPRRRIHPGRRSPFSTASRSSASAIALVVAAGSASPSRICSDGLGEYFGVKHGVLVRSVTDGSRGCQGRHEGRRRDHIGERHGRRGAV